ncbi:ATP-binding protein [Actinomadura litoris]|uniref:ATP-binding protein n=1 Tax=Actinomadura litoris TaxID=2678616 RepID=UPI001FA7C502|nr:ATP-binding protein [Actinomadura litoris]
MADLSALGEFAAEVTPPSTLEGVPMPAIALTPEPSVLVLAPSELAAACARRFVSARFWEMGVADDHVGRLVVTELVTNAYRHVGFGHIIVRVVPEEGGGLVRVEVWDQGAGMPVIRAAELHDLCGRGLALVAALVHDWGVRPLNEEGKIVWARCAV